MSTLSPPVYYQSSTTVFTVASSTHSTPPLHSPSGRESSAESSPVSTPTSSRANTFTNHYHRQPDSLLGHPAKAPDLFPTQSATDEFSSDDILFPDDPDGSGVALFPDHSYPHIAIPNDTMPSPPINIATPRAPSNSPPRNQQSNLTSQLRQPQPDNDMEMDGIPNPGLAKPRQESVSMLSTTPYGAKAIPVRDGMGFRRESHVGLSGSLMGGMSWGGLSMGSFVRDDLLMTGTSPMMHTGLQSPSLHSSSYLPKMEANYMKDYVCCDIRLDSMHELLQHYEEAHAAQPNQTMGRTPRDQQFPSSRAANASSTAQAVQQQAQSSHNTPHQQYAQPQPSFQPGAASPLFNGQHHDQMAGFDGLDDMEMDDGMPASQSQQPQGAQFQPQPQFGRQQPRAPQININIANAFQGQGLNSADPSTPHANNQNYNTYQSNPSVSAVNTPTLTNAAAQRIATPDSSTPGTPAESDIDYSQLGNIDYNQLMQGNYDPNSMDMNGNGNKGFPASALANNSEIAKRVRENQLLNGLAGVGGFVGEEIKPFKCPVIGCEKAYKNQNGLKYHKQHGHQNQQLKENADGTFSIVDPATSIPYPGTVGMEKEKPYRCEVCGKRYKNLNGLKYHRQHSPPCNPEFKLNPQNVPGMPNNLQGMSVNVAGAGLTGMATGIGY